MKTRVWITTTGEVRFLEVLEESLRKHGGIDDVYYMLDEPISLSKREFLIWNDGRHPVVPDNNNLGINGLWNRCVRLSEECDLCVVLNDDIYLLPHWLDMIKSVMYYNPTIALVGISCDQPRVWQELEGNPNRWFTDRSIFGSDNLARFFETPVKTEPWTSGFCWACRPRPWIDSGGVNPKLWWSYGEMDMALRLFKNEWLTASIYYPLCYHYGGGASSNKKARERAGQFCGDDARVFEEAYGTVHAHLLLPGATKAAQEILPEPIWDPQLRERVSKAIQRHNEEVKRASVIA